MCNKDLSPSPTPGGGCSLERPLLAAARPKYFRALITASTNLVLCGQLKGILIFSCCSFGWTHTPHCQTNRVVRCSTNLFFRFIIVGVSLPHTVRRLYCASHYCHHLLCTCLSTFPLFGFASTLSCFRRETGRLVNHVRSPKITSSGQACARTIRVTSLLSLGLQPCLFSHQYRPTKSAPFLVMLQSASSSRLVLYSTFAGLRAFFFPRAVLGNAYTSIPAKDS